MFVEFHRNIKPEVKEIVDWYNERSDKAGGKFKVELDSAIDELLFMPERWPILYDDVRAIVLTQFPYLVYYRIVSESHIRITSVKHQRREPDLNRVPL